VHLERHGSPAEGRAQTQQRWRAGKIRNRRRTGQAQGESRPASSHTATPHEPPFHRHPGTSRQMATLAAATGPGAGPPPPLRVHASSSHPARSSETPSVPSLTG